MSLNINVGGVWKAPSPWINVGGAWKRPIAIFANVAGVWKQVWVGITAALNSTGQPKSGTATSVSFSAVHCSVTGNTGAPTYNWTVVSTANGDGGTWSISSGQGTPDAVARVTGAPMPGTAQGALSCAVTVDGQTITSGQCILNYTNTSNL